MQEGDRDGGLNDDDSLDWRSEDEEVDDVQWSNAAADSADAVLQRAGVETHTEPVADGFGSGAEDDPHPHQKSPKFSHDTDDDQQEY